MAKTKSKGKGKEKEKEKTYEPTIHMEAAYVLSRGIGALEYATYGTYAAVLAHWFAISNGYITDAQVLQDGKPEFVIIQHSHNRRNPLLVVELKRPNMWPRGQRVVEDQLHRYMVARFPQTHHDVIYGLGGIGINHWCFCKLERKNLDKSQRRVRQIIGWHTKLVTSDSAYKKFETIVATHVYALD